MSNKQKTIYDSYYGEHFLATQQFRDFLQKGDIKGAEGTFDNVANEPHPFYVTGRECTKAVQWKQFGALKWLIEDLGLVAEWKAVYEALIMGQYEMVLYLLQKNSPFQLGYVFQEYQNTTKGEPSAPPPSPTIIDQFKRELKIEIVMEPNIHPVIIVACAISRFYKYEVHHDYLANMVLNAIGLPQLEQDAKYALHHVYQPPTLLLNDSVLVSSLLLKGKIKEWHPYVKLDGITSRIVTELAECFDRLTSENEQKLTMLHIDKAFQEYKIDLTKEMKSPMYYKKPHCVPFFVCLLKHVQLDKDLFCQWINEHIHQPEFLQPLIDHANQHQLWSQLSSDQKFQLIDHALSETQWSHNTSMLDFLQLQLNLQSFSWLDYKKRQGVSTTKRIQQKLALLKSSSSFTAIIDYKEPIPIVVEEKWYWYGFGIKGRPSNGTYQRYDYKQVPQIDINPLFASITTLQKLQENLELIEKHIQSPTGCFFDLDEKTGIFFRDSQDCIQWALDTTTLRVYAYDDDNPYQQNVVAHSLPEFLTRIKIENDLFYGCQDKVYQMYVEETQKRMTREE